MRKISYWTGAWAAKAASLCPWGSRSLEWALAALASAGGLICWLRPRGISSPEQRRKDSDGARDLFDSLSNAAEVGVLVCDKDGCIIESNALFNKWAGKAKNLADLSGGRPRQDLLDAFSMGAQNKAKVRWEGWVGEAEAKAMASLVMVPFEDAKGSLFYVGALRDASEKGRLEMRLAFERDKAERLMEAVNEAVLYLDAYGHVERASSGMLELLGKTGQDVRGLWVGNVLRLVDRFEAVEAPIEELLTKGRVDSDRWLVERGSGELAPMELRWRKLRDESLEGVMSLRDISARVSEMDKMKWEASHDALTGLLNRRAFGLAIEELQLRMARERTPTAILTIDLDGFKEVNDIHGHEFGDEILKLVAQALVQASAPFDYVARLGGDEFVVVMQGIGADDARGKIQEFERAVTCATVKTPKGLARVGASIGVAELAVDDAKAAKALRHADGEMYAIKKARKSGRA